MKKDKKPFNAKLFYRRTYLIIYDIISVIFSSYIAVSGYGAGAFPDTDQSIFTGEYSTDFADLLYLQALS